MVQTEFKMLLMGEKEKEGTKNFHLVSYGTSCFKESNPADRMRV